MRLSAYLKTGTIIAGLAVTAAAAAQPARTSSASLPGAWVKVGRPAPPIQK